MNKPRRGKMIGKKAPGGPMQPFQFKAPKDWLAKVDKWRKRQEGFPSRASAIRTLVERQLEAESEPNGKKKGGQ
jgi:hypothetical protein